MLGWGQCQRASPPSILDRTAGFWFCFFVCLKDGFMGGLAEELVKFAGQDHSGWDLN